MSQNKQVFRHVTDIFFFRNYLGPSISHLPNFLDTFQTPSRQTKKLPDTIQTPSRHLPDTFESPTRNFKIYRHMTDKMVKTKILSALWAEKLPIHVFTMESSDFDNIAKSTHVVNISPIAVSAQEILSFTRVDGSTYISIYLSLLQHLCDHTAVSTIVVRL